MTTPVFTLPTSGSDPRKATKEGLEENINQIITYLDEARISGDAALMTGLSFQGGWDASAGTFPDQDKDGGPITKGDFFWVSVESTFGGTTYSINEPLVALVDAPSTIDSIDWYHAPINPSLVPIVSRIDSMPVQFSTVASFFSATLSDIKTSANKTTGVIYVDVNDGQHSYLVDLSQTSSGFTTTAGVKITVLPSSAGHFNAAAWNPPTDGVGSAQTAIQTAIDYAHTQNRDLYVPAGIYLLTGITLPGIVAGDVDDRGKSFKLFGHNSGEPFVFDGQKGTVFKSVTNSPLLQDRLDTNPSSNGTMMVSGIYLDGTSTTPVVLLQSFYGLSTFSDCTIYQRGVGDGIRLTYTATTNLTNLYVLNSGAVNTTPGYVRTGVGVAVTSTWEAGLLTLDKITSRGWDLGFNIGSGADGKRQYNTLVKDCEVSLTTNGVLLGDTLTARVENLYAEAGWGGYGIRNLGDYSVIDKCFIGTGYAFGIDCNDTGSEGTVITNNTINTGNKEDAIGIRVAGGSVNKTVGSNTLIYTLGTDGVKGIQISGTNPRLHITNNAFTPFGGWTGVDTTEIDTSSVVNGVYGLVQALSGVNGSGDYVRQMPYLSRGAVSFDIAHTFTEGDVTGNALELQSGTLFKSSPSTPISINQLTGGNDIGRLIIIRTVSNTTFTTSAFLKLSGGTTFTGPGTITFWTEQIGGSTYAYEVSRSNYT